MSLKHLFPILRSSVQPSGLLNTISKRMYSESAPVKPSKELLSKLRKESGLPFNLCGDALAKNGNDYTKALEWAQDQAKQLGLKKIEKLKERLAAEGLVAICVHNSKGAIVELNCETDFVSRNTIFQDAAQKIAASALQIHNTKVFAAKDVPTQFDPANTPPAEKKAEGEHSQDGSATGVSINSILESNIPNYGKTVQDLIVDITGKLGEKIELRRASVIDVDSITVRAPPGPAREDGTKVRELRQGSGVIGAYAHSGHNPHYGKMGGLVSLIVNPPVSSSTSPETLQSLKTLANKLAQQVVGFNPVCVSKSQSTGGNLEDVKGAAPIPDEQILLEQVYLLDNKKKVKEILKAEGKALGHQISVGSFVRFSTGEGVTPVGKDRG